MICLCLFCLLTWLSCAVSVCAETSDADWWIKTVYNESNGLDTGEANAVLQTSDGYIWIGSYGGLLRYDGVDFENFSIGDNSVGSSSIRALYEDESGLAFSAATRSASYTNLSGGDYMFRMVVYNEDGVEGEEPRIAIHKEFHFWETAWFRVLMILLFVLAVIIVFQISYQYRVRSLKKRQKELKLIIEQSLHTFANAVDAKDKDTNGHSVRVAAYSKEIARRMNFSEEDQEWISYMALLHDIGKIGIPDDILKKTGKLSPEEWEIVKSHPRIGGEILSEFTVIPDIADGAKYHHEHFDGNGYCEGLKGEEIPLKARIIAIADSFDAMCSSRRYQSGRPLEYARAELLRCSGTQFDPDIVGYMIAMIDDGFVDQIMED
ncbi:MAG: HD domain-containing protein [Lachnospiraceae bacterium]|nr:HD domain-containing protein [Lachnospiraceae bacterium]